MIRLLPALLFSAPALAGNVLLYDDMGTFNASEPAVYATGHQVMAVPFPARGFEEAYDAGGWTAVIIESSAWAMPQAVRDVVAKAVADGTPLIFSYWDLDNAPDLWPVLGVDATETTTAYAHYAHPDAAFDPFVTFGGVLAPSAIWAATDDGDVLTLNATGAATGGYYVAQSAVGPSIAVTHGGNVIINGFVTYDYQDVDSDRNYVPDIQELYTQELFQLVGGFGTAQLFFDMPAACGVPGAITVRNLTPSGRFAVLRSAMPGQDPVAGGPCAGEATMLSGAQFLGVYRADARGAFDLPFLPRGAQCGKFYQVLDLDTCEASGVQAL